jgi:hypothetical protein
VTGTIQVAIGDLGQVSKLLIISVDTKSNMGTFIEITASLTD